MPSLGSSLVRWAMSPSPFEPSLKPSQWAPPACGQESFFPFETAALICCQQAQCCVHLPMIKETKIQLMAPVSEPSVNQVSFPAPFSALPCHWWDGGKHHLHLWSFNQSPQCPEVPFWWPWDFSLRSRPCQPALPRGGNNQRAYLGLLNRQE